MAESTIFTRQDVPVEKTWKLEDIFASNDAWEAEFAEVTALTERAGDYQGTLNQGADHLFEALSFRDELSKRLQILYTYAHMRHDEDTANNTYQAMESRIKTLYVKASTASSYFIPELLELSDEQVESYLQENKELQLYRQLLDEIAKQRPHVLSKEQEELVSKFAEVSSAPATIFGNLNNADLEFPKIKDENGEEVQLTHGRYIRFLESKDRRVREDAFKAMYSTFGQFKNTFAAILSGNVKGDNVQAAIRNYPNARAAAMASNHIPEEVYDNLVSTINNNVHLLHRYVKLRKQVMGLDELHMYDLFAPLVKEVDMEYRYEEAAQTMVDSFAPLGEDYVNTVKKGLEDRWVDVEETKGKRSGAYSSGSYGTNPYILMNWQNNVNNLFTLAHEFGHSMHSYYSRTTQPFVYGDYSIFVAEVASTTNEALLNDYLLKTIDDPKKKIYLLNHWLEGFRGTIFRQTMFAEFEHLIHELDQQGVPLTAEKLTEEYFALNKKYFGEDMVVDEEIGLEWARIPHFYYNYYVYQYATGLSAATALSKQILEEGQPAVDRYINNFLKAGSSDYPIEVLKAAGVDMTSAKAIEEACQVFEEKLTELENLLAQQ
ncbi:oligoendopeptidase F [Chryseomicrobium excrementi]|uniref:Oligopeptidase F n=1 Tax=Chryseomicrobium excrementi TaxID=2041346 RepID=A0A2M9F3J5_9BACL|nr:oligoendopeptidase F [Chryseomicrobium excrementi]PJK18041.1 oligoendopeptidase F [Chryseomicrobium excrementi]